MTTFRRRTPLIGIARVNPDRENAMLAFLLGSLARGRTTIEEFRWTELLRSWANWLRGNGFSIVEQPERALIEGCGFPGRFSPLQTLPQHPWARHLALCLLSADTETLFQFDQPVPEQALRGFALAEREADRIRFAPPDLTVRARPETEIPHETRTRLLLQALLHQQTLDLTETTPVRDALSGMLSWFGAPLQIQVSGGLDQLDELERRMARLQGIKTERRVHTHLDPCKMLTGKDYVVAGDVTEAAALALMATLIHGSSLTIPFVSTNPTRSGFFGALKRMGAHIEFSLRRERYGDQFASVKIQSVKRLQGRRLAGDTLIHCLEEIPLLAVAAAFAEGETILRLPDHRAQKFRPLLEDITSNLKRTGTEIGIYEEGLVIRGKEEVDGADFNPSPDHPAIGLALIVLAAAAHGNSQIAHADAVTREFPDFPRLDQVAAAEEKS